jgi:hypothetical protein
MPAGPGWGRLEMGQYPTAAATAHAAAPRASARRGLVSWDTAPMIGEPIRGAAD